VRIALENAFSAASALALTEATITEVPEQTNLPAEPEMARNLNIAASA
jgi:hypothetical protein